MSLNYDLTRVDHNSVYWTTQRTDEITEALIFLTVAIDMGDLTVHTAPEFYSRVYTWEHCRGAMCQDRDSNGELLADRPITWADVIGHIGLKTNVFSRSSRPAFVAKLTRAMREGFMSTPDPRLPAEIQAEIRALMREGLIAVINDN